MKIVACVLALALVVGSFAPGLAAAETPPVKNTTEPSKIAEISSTIAAITGIAISPLLGTGVYGAYRYISTPEEQRDTLPWFAHVGFFVPALLIAGVCAAKDTFGVTFPPGWKKPLDVAEALENKLSGLIAAGAVIPITMSSLSKILVSAAPTDSFQPAALGFATLGAMDFSWLVSIVTVPVGIAIFALVWMASHAINVLILLSPWGAIDAALKAARVSLLGLLTVTTQMDPENGAVLAILIIVAAYLVSGWAFRLTTFGTVFCWDFFTRRRKRFTPAKDANLMFSGAALAEKVPIRTYGRLSNAENGKYVFRYRPWLVLPERQVEVPAQDVVIARGLIFVDVCENEKVLFTLPPRYCGHEEQLVHAYRFARVEDAGLRKAWSWLGEAMGLRRPPAAATAS
jgi:hypothetical protein